MIPLAVVLVLVTTLAYVLLRRADRWGQQPPWQPPADLVARMRRLSEQMAKFGASFDQLRPALLRTGDVITLMSETWVLGLHRRLPDRALCSLDAKPWPCPEHERLAASIAARKERLGVSDAKVSADSSTNTT